MGSAGSEFAEACHVQCLAEDEDGILVATQAILIEGPEPKGTAEQVLAGTVRRQSGENMENQGQQNSRSLAKVVRALFFQALEVGKKK
jgi:hypothetical protein